MPAVRPTVVGILTADWHLSLKPPVCRSKESNWLETQASYLRQLRRLQHQLEGKANLKSDLLPRIVYKEVPIILAGDVFHKWNSPAELINFAIREMPDKVYAIPGNHDLENHNLATVQKTSYWTLVEAGKIIPIDGNGVGNPITINDKMVIHPFPYGIGVEPLKRSNADDLYQHIAAVHQYVWTDKTGYPGAPEDHRLEYFRKKCSGYDVVVIGDNHKPFIATKKTPVIVNTGSLMRTTIDQIDYKPRVWLLYSDNSVEPYYLDVEKDVMYDARDLSKIKVGNESLKDFLTTLKDLKEANISFEEAVVRIMRKKGVDEEIQNIILCAIEEESKGVST